MADWLSYSNQGATRSLGLDPKLAEALSFLREMGVTADVFSGGQPGQGSGQPRVGSTRHDHGMAADVRFIKDGRALDWSNPQDVPLFQEIVKRGKAAGLTGFGAGPGYMGQGTMHVGFGAPAVWGAGGKGSNAPSWLRDAYYGAPAVAADTMAALGRAPTGGSPVNTLPQSPAQAPAKPSFWDKLGPLSDPDRRARLAIALEGMTLNPNKGLIENAQAGIEDRRGQQATNRTAEWLRSQGRGDLADAIMSGALSGKDAASILYTAPKENYQSVSGKELNARMGTSFPEGDLFNISPSGQITKVGGGGTTVNVDQGGGKFEEGFAKGDADLLGTVYASGLQAQRNMGRIDQLEQLLSAAPSGVEGALKSIAGEFGINTEGLSDIQAASAMINSLVPEQRQPGSGPMSDADLALFKQSLPRIINQPGGNQIIINTMRGIAQYDAAGAAIVQRLRAGEIDRPTAFRLLAERENPLSGFKAGAPAQGAPSAPAPGASSITQEDLRYLGLE
jgi:hypothetical protein